jgi:hypothetical protein
MNILRIVKRKSKKVKTMGAYLILLVPLGESSGYNVFFVTPKVAKKKGGKILSGFPGGSIPAVSDSEINKKTILPLIENTFMSKVKSETGITLSNPKFNLVHYDLTSEGHMKVFGYLILENYAFPEIGIKNENFHVDVIDPVELLSDTRLREVKASHLRAFRSLFKQSKIKRGASRVYFNNTLSMIDKLLNRYKY